MARRKFFLGTGAGIMAYEGEDEPDGTIRFERVLHAIPDRFFGQVAVDVEAGLIYAGAVRGLYGTIPGSFNAPRADVDGPVFYRSADFGTTWEAADRGITLNGVRTMALDETTGALYVAGTGDDAPTLFRTRDCGDSWEPITTLREVPTAHMWVYHPGEVKRGWGYNPSIAMRHGILYVNVEEGWPYRSEDGGKTWHHLRNGLHIDAHVIRPDPVNPDRVWCATACGAYRSDDRGETWQYMDHGDTPPREYGTGIDVNPRDPDVVIHGASNMPPNAMLFGGCGKVFRTTDGGQTWTELGRGLPFPMPGEICIVVFDDHNGVYVGTDSGDLYFSPNNGDRWVTVDTRLPVRHFHKNTLAALAITSPADRASVFFSRSAESAVAAV